MTAPTILYGMRGPDPAGTITRAETAVAAVDGTLTGDVVVVSRDGGQTWQQAAIRVVDGETRDYESATCDDCGEELIFAGWLCRDCAADRGLL